MMRDVLIYISLLLFPLFLFSQNIDPSQQNSGAKPIEQQYDSFKKTFEKETNSAPENKVKREKNKTVSNQPPCALPAWICDFQVPDNENTLFTLGISDPGLDSANALKQATIRAKCLLSLFYKSSIQNITDSYNNEYSGHEILEKFTSFSKIESDESFWAKHVNA